MLSIAVAASTDYYLGKSGQSETMGLNAPGKVGYYEAALAGDPLAREGQWGGRLAATLGLSHGSAVKADEFRALSFGHDPKDTKRPLHAGIKSRSEQEQADKHHRILEKRVQRCKTEYFKARTLALQSGLPVNETDFVLSALSELETAQADLSGHSKNKAIREKGHDLAFSLPKSVSCHLVALLAEAESHPDPAVRAERKARADAIEKLAMEAVHRVMAHIERDIPTARPRDGAGNRSFEQMEGLAYANFMHFDSRPVDGQPPAPTGHIHCVLMNVGRRHDGDLNAVWTTYIGQNLHALGARFRAEVAQGLMGMDYDLVTDSQDKVLGFGLAGMTRIEAAKMSDRAMEIQENEQSGMRGKAARVSNRESKLDAEEFDGADFLLANAKRLAKLGHDSQSIKGTIEGRIQRVAELVEKKNAMAWTAQTEKRARWEANPDRKGRAPELPKGPKPPEVDGSPGNVERWKAAALKKAKSMVERERDAAPTSVEAIVEKCLEMDTAFTVRDVERAVCEAAQFVKLENGMTVDEYVHRQTAAILTHADVLEVQATNGPQGCDQIGLPIFTTRSQRAREVELYGGTFPKMIEARDRLHLSRPEAEDAIRKWEKTAKKGVGAKLAANQFATAVDVLTNASGFQIVQGFAGSGKTFMAECSFEILKANGAKLIAMAPSTSAANQLKRDIGASTAYTPESLEAEMSKPRGPNDAPLISRDTIVFLDESSMLDFKETHKLISAVAEAGGKVIFSGDEKQLQAVGAGNVYKRLLSIASRAMDDNRREADLAEEAGLPAVDQPRLITFLNKDFADHGTIQRQAKSVGRQIVAWAELGETLRAFDAMERRGMVAKHPTAGDKRDIYLDASRRRCKEAPAMDYPAEVALLRAAWDGTRAGSMSKADATKAKRRFFGHHSQLAKFHQQNLVVAETRKDVAGVNEQCRAALKEKGVLGSKDWDVTLPDGRAIKVAIGERLVFSEKATTRDVVFKNAELATKGTIGTVVDLRMGEKGWPEIRMVLDSGEDGKPAFAWIKTDMYADLDHAYAMTVHKSQGQTADHVQYIGNKRSNSNLFLVGASRFKKTCLVHVMEGEVEGFKSSIAVEQRKLDATDRAAAEYNLFEEGDVAEYIAAAAETRRRFDEAGRKLDLAGLAESKLRDDRARGASALRAARDGMVSKVLETMAFCADRLQGREPPIPVDRAGEKDMADMIRKAAGKAGISVERTLALGIARREGVPGRANGGGALKFPSIMESINDIVKLARRGLGIDGPDGKPVPGPAGIEGLAGLLGNPPGFAAGGLLGGGSGIGGREAAPPMAGGPHGKADQVGRMQTLRARPLDGEGADAHRLLQGHPPGGLDAGNQGVGGGHRDDAVRRGDPAGHAGGREAQTAGGPGRVGGAAAGPGRPRSDWEWLGVSGDDVASRNLRTGQIEIWSKEALLKDGRADLVRAALDRLGILGANAEEEAPKAGRLVGRVSGIGESHFMGDKTKRVLQHVDVERQDGSTERVWGARIHDALERAGVRAGDWASLDNSRKETRSVPVLASEPGAVAIEPAVVEWAKGNSAGVRTKGGKAYTLHGEQAAALAGMEGKGFEMGFLEREVSLWDCERRTDPNPIPWETRAAAAERVMAAIAAGEADSRLALLGLDKESASRLWPKGADDVERWNHSGSRSETWQAAGWAEGEGRRFLATELARDKGHAYLACAVGESDGTVETAGDRIMAVPLSSMEGVREGEWLSVSTDAKGIVVSKADPILAAAEIGDAEAVARLLSEGSSPDATDAKGRSATLLAARAGKTGILSLLLDAGAKPGEADMDGLTPILAAASHGHAESAKTLLHAGADHAGAVAAAISGRRDGCAEAIKAEIALIGKTKGRAKS